MIQTVNLVVEITDYPCFYEWFPDNRVQPYWDYRPDKGIIIIDLGTEIVDYLNGQEFFELDVIEFLDLKIGDEYISTIDPSFFKQFAKLYIYIDYIFNNKKYNTIYNESDLIYFSDFCNLKLI